MGQSFFKGVLDALYPPKCALCDRIGRPAICADCLGEFKLAPAPRLRTTSEALAEIHLIYAFEGRAAQAVKRLKYERSTALGSAMAELVYQGAAAKGWDQVELVIPVPISAKRGRERGFNQSELLCEKFDPARVRFDLLKRIRHTKPQAALKAAERLKNLEGAFEAHTGVEGRSVLLVDDVTTTGGTAVACAEALANAGASKVMMVAFCGEAI